MVRLLLASLAIIYTSLTTLDRKPTLYLIGDSTVQNNDGNGKNEIWGWGNLIKPYLDTNRITLSNQAKPGASTRTFISDSLWQQVLSALQPGDYLMLQFGHNDQSPVNDSTRARGTLKGIGDESEDIFNLRTHQQETVHTYGWYLKKMIREAKAKGVSVIVCSFVPRNKWKEGKVDRDINYVNWAREVAKLEGAWFIDLNQIISAKWETLGADSVNTFFPRDKTHTNLQGAQLNAASVIEGLRGLRDCPLNSYLR